MPKRICIQPIPNSVLYGAYAAGDAPSTPLVTGFRLYFYFGCSAPTDFSTAVWTAGLSYPANTTFISNYTLPSSTNGLWMSRALIIDGKELPFVSSGYVSALPQPFGVPNDYDLCSCNGLTFWNEYNDWLHYGQEALIDGSEIIPYASGDPWICWPTCNVEHTIQFRSRIVNANVKSCWSAPVAMIDHDYAPTNPVITSIVDNDPHAQTGISIYYTEGVPAIAHDLYRNNVLVLSNFVSGATFYPTECNVGFNYQILARNDQCDAFSEAVSGTDMWIPPEIATGATSGDALRFNPDNITMMWPSYSGAIAYRLYRGTQADLPNLAMGTTNSCTRYDNAGTFVDLSADSPASESFYWYLVTVYNGCGEGPAGTGRIINSSGWCP
jgi:hypothetical protein